MRKRFLLSAVAVLTVGVLAIAGILLWSNSDQRVDITDKDLAETVRRIRGDAPLPAPPPPVKLDLKQPVRLAIGSLGFGSDAEDRRAGDLVLAELSGARGLTLVERQSLDAVLRELRLSLSGLVRARDAVRVGKLLRADWFVLGTAGKINGTNSLVIRMVDAHTGIMRDAAVFAADQPATRLAQELSRFIRDCRQRAAEARPRVYLAIGAFEDLSPNDRLATFPSQLRSYLTAAYQGGNVTLLERDAVATLLREVQLDLAGLTDGSNGGAAATMQSACWLVEGYYQSYENAGRQVELILDVNRMFGRRKRATFRDEPGEGLMRRVKQAVDDAMSRDSGSLVLSRLSEVRAQMLTGRELSGITSWGLIHESYEDLGSREAARKLRNVQEALNAFETAVLLEPTNREARLYLAACLRSRFVGRVVEARDYYRQILDEPVDDKWVPTARRALLESFRWSDPEQKQRWFDAAAAETPNPSTAEFYRQELQLATRAVTIQNGDGTNSVAMAKERLMDSIRSAENYMKRQNGGLEHALGLYAFAGSISTNRAVGARELVTLLPQLKTQFPDLTPHFVALVLSYQVETNTPLLSEFRAELERNAAASQPLPGGREFWNYVRYEAFPWCYNHRLFDVAAECMEQFRRASDKGFAREFDNEHKMALAFSYLAAERWRPALEIFECYSNKPLYLGNSGPWGPAFSVLLTDKETARCRQKLGLPVLRNPRQFEMETNSVCLHDASAFAADEEGIWIAIGHELVRMDFNLKTNLVKRMPKFEGIPVTSLSVRSPNAWVGTGGAGLIEFDKSTGAFRRYSVEDGLLMDEILKLQLAPDALWIGYGRERSRERGGGRFDLSSHQFKSFMSSLLPGDPARESRTGSDATPAWFAQWTHDNHPVLGDDKLVVRGLRIPQSEIAIQNKRPSRTDTNPVARTTMIVSPDELKTIEATLKTNGSGRFISQYGGRMIRPKGAVEIEQVRGGQRTVILDAEGIPAPPTALALDGSDLWVGGEGYVALVDLKLNRVKRFSYVRATEIDSIQVAGGYVWAKYECHLHRAPLRDLQ